MAYQALYRKYRPSNFDEVVGQQPIIQTLKNAIVQNRIAHAYLFCGPRGTGKTSIAKIFAKMLNCEDESNKPCGKCTNCKMVQNGSHPDIIEIDAASNNGVDEVRNLIDKVKYAPMQGKYKVYIISFSHFYIFIRRCISKNYINFTIYKIFISMIIQKAFISVIINC